MIRRLTLVILLLLGGFLPIAAAQEQGQVGVYGDYFRFARTDTNFAGVGARVGFNTNRYLGFEAEVNYDFDQAFNEGFNNTGIGSVSVVRSDVHILHGLFGPTLQTGHGAIRAFVTVKGGFINFHFGSNPGTIGGFTSSVADLRSNNVNGVLYPGGGLEGHVGPIGLRLDVGDEIYFNSGANHNLRVSFGPIFRF